MEYYIKVIAAILFGGWFAKYLYTRIRFKLLWDEFIGKWRVLSIKEKEQVLFAEYGLRLREEHDSQISGSREPEKSPLWQSVDLDLHIERHDEIVDGCPDFSTFDALKLNKSFYELLNSYWGAMRMSGDYDFFGTREELNLVFSRAEELSEGIRKYVQHRQSGDSHDRA